MIVMPTGTGKTMLFLSFLRWEQESALILVHRDELINQTVATARGMWKDCNPGVVKAQRDEWDNPFNPVIASVQSLHQRRLGKIPRDRFRNMVVDECHHAAAPSYRAIIDHFLTGYLLGVTATPQRLDGLGLADLFGPTPVYVYQLRRAVEDGMLAPPRQYAIRTDVDLDQVKVRCGDFAENDLAVAVNCPARNKVIVEAYLKHASDRRAVAFAVDLQHVKDLAEEFKKAGVSTATVTGKDKEEDRRKTLRDFAAGKFRVLVNCMVCTEGWDDPPVSCVIMARPTKSRGLYTQMVGRGFRRFAGKADCLVLDITDNSEKHKLITLTSLLGRPDALIPADAEGGLVLDVVKKAELKPSLSGSWRLEELSPWPAEERPTLDGYNAEADWQMEPPSDRQKNYLESVGYDVSDRITKGEATYLIGRCKVLEDKYPLPPTHNQKWFLKFRGMWHVGMTRKEATMLIGELKASGR
jgi:superfamily II DNA or RNA helicase